MNVAILHCAEFIQVNFPRENIETPIFNSMPWSPIESFMESCFLHVKNESQNHRMGEVGRDPWGTPLVTGLQLDSVPLMTTL